MGKNLEHLGSNLKSPPVFTAQGPQGKSLGRTGDNPSSVEPATTKTGSMMKFTPVPNFPVEPAKS